MFSKFLGIKWAGGVSFRLNPFMQIGNVIKEFQFI
jgi:hypothetical protein